MKSFLLSLCILYACTYFSFAQIIHVPADQHTIQAGIEAAGEGDTVLIGEGTYYENINFLGKPITVASHYLVDGDTSHITGTIIDGSRSPNLDTASVVTMWSGEDTTSILCGLTITGGEGTFVDSIHGPALPGYMGKRYMAGGGVLIYNSGGKIVHNIIEKNHISGVIEGVRGGLGGGIMAAVNHNHSVVIRNNLIRNNTMDQRHGHGGGISLHGGGLLVEHNAIQNNHINVLGMAGGGGIFVEYEGTEGTILTAIIRNNIISGNLLTTRYDIGGGGGIGIAAMNGIYSVQIRANLIAQNEADIGGGLSGWASMAHLQGNIFYNNRALLVSNDIGTEAQNSLTMTDNLYCPMDYWVAGCQGIHRFRVGEAATSVFDSVEGIGIQPEDSFFSVEASNGRIHIGKREGMIFFDPKSVPINMFVNHAVFIDFGSCKGTVGRTITKEEVGPMVHRLRLDVPLEQYGIIFYSANIDTSQQHGAIYRYYLKERDPDTTTNFGFMTAPHANFKARNYHFWVSQQDSLELEPPVELEISLRVHAPWYRTWWAITLYVLFLALVITFSVWIRTTRLRREKAELEKEVEKRTEELRQKNEHIVEMERLKTRFFNDISHEIRTPLSLITGPLDQMARLDHPDPRTRKWLTLALRNSQRLLELVNQLLDISRMEAGHMKLVMENSDLTSYLRILASQYSSLAESRQIRFIVDIPNAELVVWHDREKITKITNNLLSNAFKFTPQGGIVTFRVRIRNRRGSPDSTILRLIVADTGSGIPLEEREKIFTRFYRSERACVEDSGGTGIGLALALEMARLMHGEISVRSLENKGSVFVVSVRLGKDHLKEEEFILKEPEPVMNEAILESLSTAEKAPLKPRGEPGEEILIVEDNEDLRGYIREILSKDYLVIEAPDGNEGLHSAFSRIPDLIITDLMMPGVDGMELCRKLKRDERTSHIPVIMLTAKATRDNRKKGLKLGADDYIIKPFEMEELLIRIRNLLEQRKNLREKYSAMIALDWNSLQVTSLDEKFLRKLTEYITGHIDDFDLNVNQLKAEMSMSRENLFRKLKALTGDSPTNLIRTIRMKAAAEMLENSDESITRISLNTGFSNPSHFASVFRKYFGKSPQEYRRDFRSPAGYTP